MKPLCNANIEVLKQLNRLIQLCQDDYLKTPDSNHAGIGQHVRHVLDHYRAFAQGAEQRCVDYNLRTRNSEEETNPSYALQQVAQLIQWLEQFEMPYESIQVISEISLQETSCETMTSNAQRELLYLINHSIHHMAYASLLAEAKGICVPRDIGLAPGTATYERELKNSEATHHA